MSSSSRPNPFPDTQWGELVDAIKALPDEQQRHALSMYYEQDMNHAEIAAVLKVTLDELQRIFERAFEVLKPRLEPFA